MIAHPPRRHSSLRALFITLLCWILGLSLIFRFLFGAGISLGWIAAGIVFSLAAGCAWIMLQDLREAIHSLAHRSRESSIPTAPSSARVSPSPKTPPPVAGGPLPRKSSSPAKAAPPSIRARTVSPEHTRRQSLGLASTLATPSNHRRKALAIWLASRLRRYTSPTVDHLSPVRL